VVLVDRSEIESTLQPYVLRRFQRGEEAWANHLRELRKGGLGRVWGARFRALIGQSVKGVARVKHDYSGVWSQDQLPGAPAIESARYFLSWGEEGLEVRGWAEKRVHLLLLSKALQWLCPTSVLEVGSGNGLILMMLAVAHPHVRFTGMELTDAGISAARRIQSQPQLPAAVSSALPFEAAQPDAFRAVEFRQGNAARLPLADGSFDVVMTSLALEQMNQVKRQALRELARVARRAVVMLEPFRDFNATPERFYYTRSRDYLSASVSDLEQYGLKPLHVFADFPSKVTRGVGLVVAEPLHIVA
jgi:ubiquinone/menaquinone biosynthesis C-methylase UbiE